MTATWKQYEGQAVDGIPLLRLLGGGEAGAVYLGELAGAQCAIKLAPAEETVAQIPLARWQQASKLSHPHLTRIHQWGRARLNGASLVYLAMEYAEEVLASVGRPLTAKEAREMLAPAVSALQYLHGQKFAHGRIHPSNILSVNDVLKISGDAPLRFGERHTARGKASPYDPPELASSGVTAAGDVWSLGVTLVEALTKELPALGDGAGSDGPRLPDSLKPDSFRDVAAGCLRRDPALRWSMTDVAQWLERGIVPAPKAKPRRYLVPAGIAAAVVVAGAIAWPHLKGTSDSAAAPGAPAVAATQSPAPSGPPPEAPTAPPAPAPPPQAPAAKGRQSKTRPAAAAIPAPAPAAEAPPETANAVASSTPPASSAAPSPADVIPADVVHSVKPNVTAQARATIHGKVPIFVRVEADSSGAVSEAKIESGGSSKYFADLSLQAARQWKFAPGDGAHVWMLRFEFTRNGDHPVSMQASQMK